MRQDLDLLQGVWTVSSLEADGQKMPADMLTNGRIEISGDRFTSSGMGAVYEGRLELDASTTPRRLDMKFDRGPEKGNTNLGIYQLKGDRWKICVATRGTVRPSKFSSTPGSGFAVETLSRGEVSGAPKPKTREAKKAAPRTAMSKSATELEGEWQMISGVLDGQPMDQSLVKWVKRVTQGDRTTVYAGPNVMMQAEFTSDSSKSPKTIDYRNTAGSHKGKIQLGIYGFEGDRLTIFMAAPGAPRPTKFQPAPAKGNTLTVWKRA